jgi:putative transposase
VLIKRAAERESIQPKTLTLQSDRGSAMIGGTAAELLSERAITKSHSRPRVSNGDPFIEAHFKTLKYRPDYPKRFPDIQPARSWAKDFFHWYNSEHYHSGFAFLHPAGLHAGRHHQIIEQRQATLDAAYASNPARKHSRVDSVPPQMAC